MTTLTQETDDVANDESRSAVISSSKVFIVAVYMVDLACGGPEEGGWYYQCGELVRIVRSFKNENLAYEYCRNFNDRLARTLNKGRREISSVLSEGRYAARVCDDMVEKHFPSQRPHYE